MRGDNQEEEMQDEYLQAGDAVIDNEAELDTAQETIEDEYEAAEENQNLTMAAVGGVIASFACIIIWTLITVITKYQIGYMAIGVGFAVGFAIQKFGKGSSITFGILGAVLALITCFSGNFFSYVYLIGEEFDAGFFETLSYMDLESSILLVKDAFEPIDAFFYLIAVYTGFKYSFKSE